MLPKLINFLYAIKSYWYIKTQEQRCQRVDNGLFKAVTTVENGEFISCNNGRYEIYSFIMM